MALYPNVNSRPEDRDIISRMEDFKIRSISENQDLQAEASLDARFKAGDQSVYSELYQAPINRRNLYSFNRIRRNVNMITGNQRQNRKSFIATPQENGDEETASQYTKIFMWLNNQESIGETISDGFEDAVTTGVSFLKTWIDYRNDPVNGDIRVDNCSVTSVIMDPFWKKPDLSDCNGIWQRSYITAQEAASLLPNHAEEISTLSSNGLGADGNFVFMPQTQNFLASNLLPYDEFWYRAQRKQRVVIDTQTGEVMEWKSNDEDALRQFLQDFPTVIVNDQMIPTVRLAVVIQGRVYYDGGNPLKIDNYPFVPILGYFDPNLPTMSDRFQGIVRGLRDAQYLYNRRRLIELDMLESQVTTGIIYKEDSLVDPKQAFMTGQGRAIVLKKNAQMTDVQQITPSQIPPSMMQLSEVLSNEIQQIVGVPDVSLGLGDSNNKSGYDTMLKQRASLAMLQGLFDGLDRSQKLLGKLILNLVQENFGSGKVKRIIEEEPTQEFYNKNFGKYDVVIEDGFDTSTQKAMQFAQLLQLRESGVPVPDSVLIESCTLQNKQDLITAIEQTQQAQQQMQQQQAEVAMQELQSRTNLANSRAEADRGLAAERESKISLNNLSGIERLAESEKDSQQAKLNYITGLAKLEEIDLAKLERLVALSKLIDEPAKQDAKPTVPMNTTNEISPF